MPSVIPGALFEENQPSLTLRVLPSQKPPSTWEIGQDLLKKLRSNTFSQATTKGGASHKNPIDKGPCLQNHFLRDCTIKYPTSLHSPRPTLVQLCCFCFTTSKTNISITFSPTCFISPLIQGLWARDKDEAKDLSLPPSMRQLRGSPKRHYFWT